MSREAVDKLTERIKKHNEVMGFNKTGEDARRKAIEIAEKSDKEKGRK